MKLKHFCLIAILSAGLSLAANAAVKVDVIKNPYSGARNSPELSTNPDYIHAAGLERLIGEWGGELIRPIQDIRLNAKQERQYGEWNRMALANANFADVVREGLQDDLITIGLEANCNDLLGMLSGLKYDSDGNARRVGLVFIDAHGDFNIPETTLSGMLGGMPVAIAAGHALHNVRKTTGLAEPLPMSDIVWGGVRDLDPLEAATLAALCLDDLRGSSQVVITARRAMVEILGSRISNREVAQRLGVGPRTLRWLRTRPRGSRAGGGYPLATGVPGRSLASKLRSHRRS